MVRVDNTEQERLVRSILSDLGLRFTEQYKIGMYTVDFVLPDEKIVIEADGVYGHFRKDDKKRDKFLKDSGILSVLHIKETTKKDIQKRLEDWLCLE